MLDKQFPVLYVYPYKDIYVALDCPKTIPWSLIEKHAETVYKNHHQTLQRLSERGGLDPIELYAVLNDKRYREIEHISMEEAIKFLKETYNTWQKQRNINVNKPDLDCFFNRTKQKSYIEIMNDYHKSN